MLLRIIIYPYISAQIFQKDNVFGPFLDEIEPLLLRDYCEWILSGKIHRHDVTINGNFAVIEY